MDLGAIYWPAVAACVVFSMVSGSIWFAPRTFFPVWWRAIGKSATDVPTGTPLTWVLLIGSSAVQAVFLAMLVHALGRAAGGATLASGATTGFLIWLGLIAPSSLVNKLFPGRLTAWSIETGNHLINFVAFGAILGAWH